MILIASFTDSIIAFRGNLIKKLVEDYDVLVYSPYLMENKQVCDELIKIGAKPRNLNFRRDKIHLLHDLFNFLGFVNVLLKEKPKFVISYTLKPIFISAFASLFFSRIKFFLYFTGLGRIFISNSISKLLVISFLRLLPKKNSFFLFQNHEDKKYFLKLKILNAGMKYFVSNGSGVDVDYYEPIEQQINKPYIFTFIGRIQKEKGVMEFYKAAKKASMKYNYIKFRLVGFVDTNDADILKLLKTSNGSIEYIGEVDDIRKYISDSYATVLPSWREGTPRSMLESMAMEVPIIISDAPGCSQLISNDDAGIKFKSKSWKSLFDAIEKSINDKNFKEKGKVARQKVVEYYEVNKVSNSLIKFFKNNI